MSDPFDELFRNLERADVEDCERLLIRASKALEVNKITEKSAAVKTGAIERRLRQIDPLAYDAWQGAIAFGHMAPEMAEDADFLPSTHFNKSPEQRAAEAVQDTEMDRIRARVITEPLQVAPQLEPTNPRQVLVLICLITVLICAFYFISPKGW